MFDPICKTENRVDCCDKRQSVRKETHCSFTRFVELKIIQIDWGVNRTFNIISGQFFSMLIKSNDILD